MLFLSCRSGDVIRIGDAAIVIGKKPNGTIGVGLDFPPEVVIYRAGRVNFRDGRTVKAQLDALAAAENATEGPKTGGDGHAA